MGIDPVGVDENNVHSHNRYAYANNNPYKYVDPDGRYADLAIEVVSIGAGVYSFDSNLAQGNYGDAAIDGIGVVVDGALAIVPGVPGVVGLGITAARGSDNAVDAAVTANRADSGSDTARQALRKAKEANGIPKSAQPDKIIKAGSPGGAANGLDKRNTKLYEYTNSSGKKIHIRQDKPASYGQGGRGDQGAHFNSGPAKEKLKRHDYYKN